MKKLNIVLITLDCVRLDHLNCYVYKRVTSPFINAFANNNIIFENCISHSSWTQPAMASLFTSLYPEEHGVKKLGDRLSNKIDTIAKTLSKNSFLTAGFPSNATLIKKFGFNNGFQIYDDKLTDHELVRKNMAELKAHNIVKKVIPWLEKNKNKNFFLWIHFQDAHGAYNPPDPYNKIFVNDEFYDGSKKVKLLKKGERMGGIEYIYRHRNIDELDYYIAQYDGEIRYIDDHIKIIFNKLIELNIYDNSLIIITSDHGESMTEHNFFFNHGINMYDELIRVPLIIKFPNKIKKRVNSLVCHLDIFPTILDVCNIHFDGMIRGKSLIKTVLEEKEIHDFVYSSYSQDGFSCIRTLRWKLIFDTKKIPLLLFDLKKDPMEKYNLINEKTFLKIKNELIKKYKKILFKKISKSKKVDISYEKIKIRLENLGYL